MANSHDYLEGDNLWVSIMKSGDRNLNRIGKGASHAFRLIHRKHVIYFVKFNMTANTLLVSGRVLLQQGRRGITIGEFLSA